MMMDQMVMMATLCRLYHRVKLIDSLVERLDLKMPLAIVSFMVKDRQLQLWRKVLTSSWIRGE